MNKKVFAIICTFIISSEMNSYASPRRSLSRSLSTSRSSRSSRSSSASRLPSASVFGRISPTEARSMLRKGISNLTLEEINYIIKSRIRLTKKQISKINNAKSKLRKSKLNIAQSSQKTIASKNAIYNPAVNRSVMPNYAPNNATHAKPQLTNVINNSSQSQMPNQVNQGPVNQMNWNKSTTQGPVNQMNWSRPATSNPGALVPYNPVETPPKPIASDSLNAQTGALVPYKPDQVAVQPTQMNRPETSNALVPVQQQAAPQVQIPQESKSDSFFGKALGFGKKALGFGQQAVKWGSDNQNEIKSGIAQAQDAKNKFDEFRKPNKPLAITDNPNKPLAITDNPNKPLAITDNPNKPLAITDNSNKPLAIEWHDTPTNSFNKPNNSKPLAIEWNGGKYGNDGLIYNNDGSVTNPNSLSGDTYSRIEELD